MKIRINRGKQRIMALVLAGVVAAGAAVGVLHPAPAAHADAISSFVYSQDISRPAGVTGNVNALASDANDDVFAAYGQMAGTGTNGADTIVEFNSSLVKTQQLTLQPCTAAAYWYGVTGLAVDGAGDIYASLDDGNGSACAEEYTLTGTLVATSAQFAHLKGIGYSNVTNDTYVLDAANNEVVVLTAALGATGAATIGGDVPSQYTLANVTSLAVAGSYLYIYDPTHTGVFIFSLSGNDGTYLNAYGGEESSLAVDAGGNVYSGVSLGDAVYIGTDSNTSMRAAEFSEMTATGGGDGANYITLPGDVTFDPQSMTVDTGAHMYINDGLQPGVIHQFTKTPLAAPGVPTNFSIDMSSWSRGSGGPMTINATAAAGDPTNQWNVQFTSLDGSETYTGTVNLSNSSQYFLYFGPPMSSVSRSFIQPQLLDGTTYNVSIQAQNAAGAGAWSTPIQITTPGTPPSTTLGVTGVNFGTDSETGDKMLTVTGGGFPSYSDAFSQSLVTLNGQALPFCTTNIGETAAQLVAAGFNAALVSDNPPCYLLASTTAIVFTINSAEILLPSNFDTTAEGTISVGGSNTYTFNEHTTPVTPLSGYVNGNKPLDQTPTIPNRPTFSGVAVPHSHIVVTMHSDPVTCEATADDNGNWSCTITQTLPDGNHTAAIVITAPDGSTTTLGPYPVIVASTVKLPNTGIKSIAQLLDRGSAQSSMVALVATAGILTLVATGIFILRRR